MKKIETGDRKIGELLKKIQMNDPKIGEKYKQPAQDAMLTGDGEEHKLIKCLDDITGKELLWQAAKEAREKELKYLRELCVYEKVERAAVAKYNVTPVDT